MITFSDYVIVTLLLRNNDWFWFCLITDDIHQMYIMKTTWPHLTFVYDTVRPQAIIFIHRHEFGVSFGELTRPRIFEFKNATLKQAIWLAASQLIGEFDALLVKQFKDADWSIVFNITCVYIPFMTKRFLPQKWKLFGCTEFGTIFMSPYDKSYIFHKIKKNVSSCNSALIRPIGP